MRNPNESITHRRPRECDAVACAIKPRVIDGNVYRKSEVVKYFVQRCTVYKSNARALTRLGYIVRWKTRLF